MRSVWEEVKGYIKETLSEKSFSLWIHPITLLNERDDSLVLGCPNKFSLNWVTEHYLKIIEEGLEKIGVRNCKVILKVMALERKRKVPDLFKPTKQLTIPNMSVHRGNGRRRLYKDFTFDRFVVGKCNEFAYSASRAVAMGENWSYDSLFMHSGTGLGKSHLSQSIGHALLENDPDIRAYYITAEDFVNEMIFALKNNRIEEFKNRYRRSCDVLLLEEVHFFSGKEKIQRELEYTLDALTNGKKKIIFTSPLLPKDIPNISKELASRLTSGIIAPLGKPDYSTRIKIIEKKAAEHKIRLSEDITHFLAKNLTRDIRQIESALRCLRAKSELLHAKINLDLAKEVIKCHVPEQNQISIESIKKMICHYFKIEPLMLTSKSRKKIHSYPRNIYVYLCRNHTDATLEDIGRSINRNHSTILYSSEVIEKKTKTDNQTKNHVNFFKEKILEMVH